jgi:hypothetical protein
MLDFSCVSSSAKRKGKSWEKSEAYSYTRRTTWNRKLGNGRRHFVSKDTYRLQPTAELEKIYESVSAPSKWVS